MRWHLTITWPKNGFNLGKAINFYAVSESEAAVAVLDYLRDGATAISIKVLQ